MEEGARSYEGTHRTKRMVIKSTVLFFVPEEAQVLLHLVTEHTCWRGESNSSERLAGPGAPGGCPRGCSVPAVPAEGQGRRPWRGESTAGPVVPASSHNPATAPPAKEQRGPARGGWGALTPVTCDGVTEGVREWPL